MNVVAGQAKELQGGKCPDTHQAFQRQVIQAAGVEDEPPQPGPAARRGEKAKAPPALNHFAQIQVRQAPEALRPDEQVHNRRRTVRVVDRQLAQARERGGLKDG